MSFQKTTIIGNLGKDPEVKYLDGSGTCVAAFSVATSDSYRNKAGEKIATTEWWRCVAWNKLGEVVEKYLHKGSKVHLELKKKEREYESQGETKRITEFQVLSMVMLDPKPQDGQQSGNHQHGGYTSNTPQPAGQKLDSGTVTQANAFNNPPAQNFDDVENGPDDLPF